MRTGLENATVPRPVRQPVRRPDGRKRWRPQQLLLTGWYSIVKACDDVLPITLPRNPLRVGWTLLVFSLVLYMAIDVPLLIALKTWRGFPAVNILGWISSLVMSLDIVVDFRTAYITGKGEIIRNPRLVAAHYLRTMFVLDLVSGLPVDDLVETLVSGEVHRSVYWLGLLKIPRLFTMMQQVTSLAPMQHENLVAVARLMVVMLLITHWAACLWIFLSQEIPGMPWVFSVLCRNWSDRDIYLYAFYRCFLTMLGDRPLSYNNIERGFFVFLLFLGACMYAVVMSTMTLLISNIWSMASRHRQRAAMLQDALRYQDAEEQFHGPVDRYFYLMAQYDHPGAEGVALLSELPAPLHTELLATVCEPMLLKVQMFASCQRPFLWRLAQRLRLSVYMPRDLIYEIGSVGHEMFFIRKGAVGLLEPDGAMVALMADGDHFGELGLMTASTPRPHRAVALQATDVMVLARWDLQDAMRDFPDSATLVKGRARVQLEDHEVGLAVWMALPALQEEQRRVEEGQRRTQQSGKHPLAGQAAAGTGTGAGAQDLGTGVLLQDASKRIGVHATTAAAKSERGEKGDALNTSGLRRRAQRRLAPLPLSQSAPANAVTTIDGGTAVAEATENGSDEEMDMRAPRRVGARRRQDSNSRVRISEEVIYAALFGDTLQGLSTPTATIQRPSAAAVTRSTETPVREARAVSRNPSAKSNPSKVASVSPEARRGTAALELGRQSTGREPHGLHPQHSRLMRAVQDAIAASSSVRSTAAPHASCCADNKHSTAQQQLVPDTTTLRAGGAFSADAYNREGTDAPAGREGTPSATAAQLLYLTPQPFLGPDPLGSFFDERPTSNGPSTGGHRRDSGATTALQPLTAADTPFADALFATGDDYFALSQHVLQGLAGGRRSLRAGSRGSGKQAGGGLVLPGDASRLVEQVADGAVEEWLRGQGQHQEACRNPRCEVLETQLAVTQKELREAREQLEAVRKNPFEVPAMAAALRREVASVAAQLRGQMEQVLGQLGGALEGVEARTQELSQQVAAADTRLQHWEEEVGEHGGFAGASLVSPGLLLDSVRSDLDALSTLQQPAGTAKLQPAASRRTLPPLQATNASGAAAAAAVFSSGLASSSGWPANPRQQRPSRHRERRLSAYEYLRASTVQLDSGQPPSSKPSQAGDNVGLGSSAAGSGVETSVAGSFSRSQSISAGTKDSSGLRKRPSKYDLSTLAAAASAASGVLPSPPPPPQQQQEQQHEQQQQQDPQQPVWRMASRQAAEARKRGRRASVADGSNAEEALPAAASQQRQQQQQCMSPSSAGERREERRPQAVWLDCPPAPALAPAAGQDSGSSESGPIDVGPNGTSADATAPGPSSSTGSMSVSRTEAWESEITPEPPEVTAVAFIDIHSQEFQSGTTRAGR